MIKTITIRIAVSAFTGVTVTQAICSLLEKYLMQGDVGLCVFLPMALFFTAMIFIVNGILLEGYLVRKAVIELRDIGMNVCVRRGDIFSQDGIAVVAVNDFFDTIVDDVHISPRSVHGAMINRYWGSNVLDLNVQIEEGLKDKQFEYVKRDGVAKEKKFPIGTSVFVRSGNGKRFVLVALTRTNAETHRTQAVLQDLRVAIRGAMMLSREVANGDDISFAVMGGGNARIKAPHQVLLNTLISEIISECLENDKVSNCVNIVIKDRKLNKINFHALEEEWSV